MSDGYKDKRQDFFREWFSKGLPFKEYVLTGSLEEQKKWAPHSALSLSESQQHEIARWRRKMNLLVLSGIWCGDCSRQGPMLNMIAAANSNIELRFIESRANPELQDELRINGACKVPVAVILSEDFYELQRFGDRQLSVYRQKIATESGAACDAGIYRPVEPLLVELQEWLITLERCQIILQLSPMLRRRYGP